MASVERLFDQLIDNLGEDLTDCNMLPRLLSNTPLIREISDLCQSAEHYKLNQGIVSQCVADLDKTGGTVSDAWAFAMHRIAGSTTALIPHSIVMTMPVVYRFIEKENLHHDCT